MILFLLYLLKVSLCLLLFYLFYITLFNRTTFFRLNRFYLLTGLILSFLIPLLQISIFEIQSKPIFTNIIRNDFSISDFEIYNLNSVSNVKNSISIAGIITIIYIAGLIIVLLKLLFSVKKIIRIRKNSAEIRIGGFRIIQSNLSNPFSFFNMIFIPKSIKDQVNTESILYHEKSHIRQMHWFDLALSEMVSAILWFNPFVILYKNALVLQLEYLADKAAIKNNIQPENYLRCLLEGLQNRSISSMVNHFYCKTIKKRINMLTQNETTKRRLLRYIFIIPFVLMLAGIFACINSKNPAGRNMNQSDKILPGSNPPSISPVDLKKVKSISGFGDRTNPLNKKEKQFHYAIDFALNEGEQVFATASGVVLTADFDSLKGNFVIIKHDEVFSTCYLKLKEFIVKQGMPVQKGQVIGYVGQTGIATGPHLHYEVIKNGTRVNPADYMPKEE